MAKITWERIALALVGVLYAIGCFWAKGITIKTEDHAIKIAVHDTMFVSIKDDLKEIKEILKENQKRR